MTGNYLVAMETECVWHENLCIIGWKEVLNLQDRLVRPDRGPKEAWGDILAAGYAFLWHLSEEEGKMKER